MSDKDTKVTEESTATSLQSFWQSQYEEAASGGQSFLFFKKSRTRIRLLPHTKDFKLWVQKVEAVYQGDKSTKFLVPGYEITDPKSQTEFKLQMVSFTKGAWASLTQMLMEGHKFFEPEGKALTVVRNPGPPVSYTLMPSPDTVEPNEQMWEEAQNFDWSHYLNEWEKMQQNKESNSTPTNSLADAIVSSNATSSEEPW